MNGVTVKVYSMAKDGTRQLAPNFKVREFACQDGSDTVFVSPELVELLQAIRDHFGKAVNVNSGYRTETHHKKGGGAAYSRHKYGLAADICISGVSPLEVGRYAHSLLPHSGGVGVYGTFTHVDVRDVKTRWDQRSGKQIIVNGF